MPGNEAEKKTALGESRNSSSRMGPKLPFRLKLSDGLALFLLLILIISSWVPRINGPIDLRWDGAVYYVLGTSLAEGKGYRLLNEPGEIEAIQYPPLLPLFVAAHQKVLGTSDPETVGRWLRLSFFCIYAALTFATYGMLRTYFSVWLAFMGTLVVLLNIFTTFLSDLCFADIPFALATVLFVICDRKSSSRSYGALAVLFATTAFLLRSAGIAVFAAWVAESLIRREFKRAAVRLLIASIPVLAWQTYLLHVEHTPSYTKPAYTYQRAGYMFYNVSYATNVALADPFHSELGRATPGQLATRFAGNLLRMPASLGEAVSAKKDYWKEWLKFRGQRFPILKMVRPWLCYVPLGFLGGLIFGGIAFLIKNRDVVVPVYILAMLAAVCLTPWPEQFPRYWSPVAPFLVMALFLCLAALWKYCRTISRKSIKWSFLIFIAAVVGVVLISESYSQYQMYRYEYRKVRYRGDGHYRLFFYGSGYESLDDGLDWLKRRAKPDDIVAASMPQWVYLRTGLKAVMPPFEPNLATAQNLLDSVPVGYIVLDTKTGVNFASDYMIPLVRNAPQYWKPVYADEEGGLQIYERVRGQNRDTER